MQVLINIAYYAIFGIWRIGSYLGLKRRPRLVDLSTMSSLNGFKEEF